nr:autotransporter domain-containing protein [uncultured Cohaesibacter sp.]
MLFSKASKACRIIPTSQIALLSGATIALALTHTSAQASCVTTGTIASGNCDASSIQYTTGSGASSIIVDSETTIFIEFKPENNAITPTSQSLRVIGNTIVSNPTYSAIYSQTSAPEHDLDVYLGSNVSATSVGGFGAVWLRNDVSGDLAIENHATVQATGGPGITLVTNMGNVDLVNYGVVTSTDDRGLYGDGGKNNVASSPVVVSITNAGTVNANTAGIRAINYQGLSEITNSGTVTTTTRQGVVAWSANGATKITNSGTVTAHDDFALQAWSTSSDVTVVNSGTLNAYDDTSHTDIGTGHDGIQAYADTSGNVYVTNTSKGVVNAPDATAISGIADNGNISIANAGSVIGLNGIDADAPIGSVKIANRGTISVTGDFGVNLKGGSLTNSGTIQGGSYGVRFEGSSNTITTSGKISGSTASIYYNAGGNRLNIESSASFNGLVDFNNTINNTTGFGAGSYSIPVARYLADKNTVQLDSNKQQVIYSTAASSSGAINVVEAGASASMFTTTQTITSSASTVMTDILSIDIDRNGPVYRENGSNIALGYTANKKNVEAENAIATMVGDGVALDAYGNMFWMRAFGGQSFDTSADTTAGHYGLALGFDHAFDQGRFGVMAGLGRSSNQTNDDTSKVTGDTAFGGLYARQSFGDYDFDSSLIAGGISSEADRQINLRAETAKGKFDGWFVSPELAISRAYGLPMGWTLTPKGVFRYTHGFFEGYSEHGSSQNITYDSRTTDSVQAALEVKLTKQHRFANGQQASLSFVGSVLDIYNLSDSAINASLQGTDFTIATADDRNVIGGKLGINTELNISSQMTFFAGANAGAYTNSTWDYSGNAGLKIKF